MVISRKYRATCLGVTFRSILISLILVIAASSTRSETISSIPVTTPATISATVTIGQCPAGQEIIPTGLFAAGTCGIPNYWPGRYLNLKNPPATASCPDGYILSSFGPLYAPPNSALYFVGVCTSTALYYCRDVPINEIAFALDAGGLTCSRPDQKTYTLTLTPEQTTIEPSGTAAGNDKSYTQLTVTIKDTRTDLPPDKAVQIRLIAHKPTQGGHDHDDPTRPRGSLANQPCASDEPCHTFTLGAGTGSTRVRFDAPIVSGTHTFTAQCDECQGDATATLDVRVEGLIQIPDAIIRYAQFDSDGAIGAKTNTHEHNHYLTPASIIKLNKLADVYAEVNPGFRLFLNDASLEWGGLFDVGTTRWKKPHKTHRRGTSLDIRAASAAGRKGEVPASKFMKFINEAADNNLTVGLHCLDSTDTQYCLGQPNNRHFHADF
jgi:hypothetical protein